MTETPIEDYLDELLRRTRADARTTRRLLDEASDHLHAAAAELRAEGMSRQEAEIEAVRRFGPVTPIVRATLRRSLAALVFETLRAALFLAGCGLVAVGISGLVAFAMNLWFGRSFVGGVSVFGFGRIGRRDRGRRGRPARHRRSDRAAHAARLPRPAPTRELPAPTVRRAGRRAGRGRLRRRHGRARDRVCRPSRAERHQWRWLPAQRCAGRSSGNGVLLRPRRSRSAAVPLKPRIGPGYALRACARRNPRRPNGRPGRVRRILRGLGRLSGTEGRRCYGAPDATLTVDVPSGDRHLGGR